MRLIRDAAEDVSGTISNGSPSMRLEDRGLPSGLEAIVRAATPLAQSPSGRFSIGVHPGSSPTGEVLAVLLRSGAVSGAAALDVVAIRCSSRLGQGDLTEAGY